MRLVLAGMVCILLLVVFSILTAMIWSGFGVLAAFSGIAAILFFITAYLYLLRGQP